MSGSVYPCDRCGKNTWNNQIYCDDCRAERLPEIFIDDSEAEYYEKDRYDQITLLTDIMDKEPNPYKAFDKISAAIDVVRTKLGEAARIEDKQERDAAISYQRFILRSLATAVQEHGLVASTGYDANVVLRGADPKIPVLTPGQQAQADRDLEEVSRVFSKEPVF